MVCCKITISKLKSKDVCLSLSLIFIYVIAYNRESGRHLFGDWGLWFDSGQGYENYLFSKAFRLSL